MPDEEQFAEAIRVNLESELVSEMGASIVKVIEAYNATLEPGQTPATVPAPGAAVEDPSVLEAIAEAVGKAVANAVFNRLQVPSVTVSRNSDGDLVTEATPLTIRSE